MKEMTLLNRLTFLRTEWWDNRKGAYVYLWKWKCPTLCDCMDYTVHGILQARILDWVAVPFSRGSCWPMDRTQVSHIAGELFTSWATREAHLYVRTLHIDVRQKPTQHCKAIILRLQLKKKINPKDVMYRLVSVTNNTVLCIWKRLWCWEGLGEGGEGDDRGWDGWMASLTRWTWVSVNSGSWWWTGRPGVLRFMGSKRVGHDWATDLIWTEWTLKFLIIRKDCI